MQIDSLRGACLRGVPLRGSMRPGAVADGRTSLQFDEGTLTIDNPFTLACDSGEPVGLSDISGCHITAAFTCGEELVIEFEGRISLRVSLRDEDFLGPVAATWHAHTGETLVFD